MNIKLIRGKMLLLLLIVSFSFSILPHLATGHAAFASGLEGNAETPVVPDGLNSAVDDSPVGAVMELPEQVLPVDDENLSTTEAPLLVPEVGASVLSLSLEPATQPEVRYTDEQTKIYLKLTMAANSSAVDDAYLQMILPKQQVAAVRAQPLPEGWQEPVITVEEDLLFLTVKLPRLEASSQILLPLEIETGERLMPDGGNLPLVARLLDGNQADAQPTVLAASEILQLAYAPSAKHTELDPTTTADADAATAAAEGQPASAEAPGGAVEDAAAGSEALRADNPNVVVTHAIENPQATYWAGQLFNTVLAFSFSNAAPTPLTNVRLRFTLPNAYVGSVRGAPLTLANGDPSVTSSDGVATVEYVFPSITGGTTFATRLLVDMKDFLTPDNYNLPITAELLDENGDSITTIPDLSLTFQALPPSIQKTIRSTNFYAQDHSGVFAGMADPNNPSLVAANTENYVQFSYNVISPPSQGLSNSNWGVRRYSQQIITDILPPGAVFDAAANPGWTYDAATNSASYTLERDFYYTLGNVTHSMASYAVLKLRFPGANTTQTYRNNMTVTFVPKDGLPTEDPVESTDPIAFRLTTATPAPNINKLGTPRSIIDQLTAKSQPIYWRLDCSNSSTDLTMDFFELRDHSMDSRLYYVSIERSIGNWYSGNFDVYVTVGGVETLLASATPLTTPVSLPADATEFRVTNSAGEILPSNMTASLRLHTALRDPAAVSYNPSNAAANDFYNSLSISTRYQGQTEIKTRTTQPRVMLTPYAPQLLMTKTIDKATAILGDVLTCTIFGRTQTNSFLAPDQLEGQKLLDLLPYGMSYVAGSATVSSTAGFTPAIWPVVSIEPEVVDNYRNTGRTALIWSFNQFLTTTSLTGQSVDFFINNLRFKMKVNVEVTAGPNTNDIYLHSRPGADVYQICEGIARRRLCQAGRTRGDRQSFFL